MQIDKSNVNEIEDHSKSEEDNNITIINNYLSYSICEPNLFMYISFALFFYFFYLKVTDNFIALWRVTFYPLYLYFIYYMCKNILFLVSFDISQSTFLKIRNLIPITLLSAFFKFIFNLLCILAIYNLHQFLDKREDDYLFIALRLLILNTLWCIIYGITRYTKYFKFIIVNNNQSDNTFLFTSTLLTPALTYFSSICVVCSGGACTQIYISTITSLLGAFGITITHVTKFMFPITCILLGISLFSLYIKKKRLTHKPFLLGVFSTALIIISNIFSKSRLYYLMYPGNICMIAAAVWNAKINKFHGI